MGSDRMEVADLARFRTVVTNMGLPGMTLVWALEHRTSNIEHVLKYTIQKPKKTKVEEARYDLEERLLEFSVRIIRLSESLPDTRAGNHVAGQFLRSGTAPLPMHGEAQSAESARDFQHKLRVALKELRETFRWLKLAQKTPLIKPASKLDPLLTECDELIRIFVTSLRTSESRSLPK